MKILYLIYFDIDTASMAGVKNKVNAQVKAMEDLKNEVVLGYVRKNQLILKMKSKIVVYELKKSSTLFYKNSVTNILISHQLLLEFDLIYIRAPYIMDRAMVRLFKYISSLHAQLVIEVPTYPIVGEYKLYLNSLKKERQFLKMLGMYTLFKIHNFVTKDLSKYIDRIVTFMPYERIWGTPTIILDNGVDTEKYQILSSPHDNKGKLILTGVANISKWHGFDRIIVGLYYYYKNNPNIEIHFNIVGEGEEKVNLEILVEKYNLRRYVHFLGTLHDKSLFDIYTQTDIAISSLGMHRIGVDNGSPIKTKEYCSLGLPFVYSYDERLLDDNFKYALKVSSTDKHVDIDEIVNFYNTLDDNSASEMHEYAVRKFDWKVQIKQLFSSLKNKEIPL